MSTSVNADFLTAQAETVVNPQFGMETELAAPDFDINANEEVATKLDLAKAYEEMGDLEGARELLQEVIKEGDGARWSKARYGEFRVLPNGKALLVGMADEALRPILP